MLEADDSKEAIQALRKAVSFVRKAGLDELKKLNEAIQDLQDAIDSIKTKADGARSAYG